MKAVGRNPPGIRLIQCLRRKDDFGFDKQEGTSMSIAMLLTVQPSQVIINRSESSLIWV